MSGGKCVRRSVEVERDGVFTDFCLSDEVQIRFRAVGIAQIQRTPDDVVILILKRDRPFVNFKTSDENRVVERSDQVAVGGTRDVCEVVFDHQVFIRVDVDIQLDVAVC